MNSWRRTLYAMWFAQMITLMGFSMRVPFLPFYVGELGASTFEQQALWAGMIAAAGAASMALTAPIWGIVSDRHGRKPMVLRSMIAGAFSIWLMALATNPWHLLGLRFVEGAFTGTVTAATALVATTVPKERLGYGLGLLQTAVFSGAAIGPLIGGVLADQFGYRATFLISGAMLFVASLVVLLFVQETFERPVRSDGATGQSGSMAGLLLGPAMLAMILLMFFLRISSSAMQPILPLFVEHLSLSVGNVATLSGLTIGVMGLTSALSAVVIGRLADRRGQRSMLIVATLLTGLLYLPQAAAHSVVELIVLQALFGVAVGGVLPTANALVANLTPPERRGAIYGFLATATALGGFLGPVGGSALAATVNIRATFIVTGLLMLFVGLWVARAVPRNLESTPATAEHPMAGGHASSRGD